MHLVCLELLKLPGIAPTADPTFYGRKWKGDSQNGEEALGRAYEYRKPPPVGAGAGSLFVSPETVPIITSSVEDIMSGKGP